MAESQIMSVIRVWAAVAWADGLLAQPEADGLRRLITSAELSAGERAEAIRYVEEKCTLPETYLTSLTPEVRRGVYRAACRMAIVDRVFAKAERRMLDRVRELLAIPSDIAGEIEADVPGLG
ncbi:MAG: TerB family tellurite resistance protein [Deltaproteobacteria bacterium]|nr:TerB family tellurite resistance protein [Deltaproteobacteria bacterium]